MGNQHTPHVGDKINAGEVLYKAAEHMIERGRQYDKPEGERSMGRCVTAFNAITGQDLSEAEGWLLLQVLKDVRQWQRPGYHADSAEDCIAYAALKAEAKSAESAQPRHIVVEIDPASAVEIYNRYFGATPEENQIHTQAAVEEHPELVAAISGAQWPVCPQDLIYLLLFPWSSEARMELVFLYQFLLARHQDAC